MSDARRGDNREDRSRRRAHERAGAPLVGRDAERRALTAALDQADAGHGSTIFLRGEGGIGKTRLAMFVADEAEAREWTIAVGRAYPMEAGVPYAPLSDALLPVLRALDHGALAVLSRGGDRELRQLFPALGSDTGSTAPRGDPAEGKAKLLWNFTQFLGRFAAKRPLLLVLENLQWADASSLELLHFAARQVGEQRIVILGSYNSAERDANAALRSTERSLESLGAATIIELAPLSREEADALVREVGGTGDAAPAPIVDALYDRTRGNPFFLTEMVKALADAGRLGGVGDAAAAGDLALPATVRDAIEARLDQLGADARRVADIAAVIGARADHDVLRQVSGLSAAAFVEAVEELERHRILDETSGETGAPAYDFTHPLLQSTIYADLGAARVRLLHANVADALERVHRSALATHADELAFHFSRADAVDATPKAARYMAMAGRRALQRYATSEARRYLEAALELSDGAGAPVLDAASLTALVEDLARARQRSGDYDGARSLWDRALADAAAAGDDTKRAAIERRLGLAQYWGGRHDDALAHYDRALAAAEQAMNDELVARVRIARGMALQELGRPADAQQEVRLALAAAERVGSAGMLARAHRALLLLHVFTGPAEVAAEHGRRSIALAAESGEKGVEWSAHWGMAMLAGFTGDAGAVARHAEASARLTDELRSPVLRAWTDEVLVEYAAGVGDWDAGLALAGRTIGVARALGQRTLLPRLLVWTGLMRLWRGAMDEARALFEESWTISGAGRERRTGVDVHTVVPAHTGMAAYHVALGEYARAIEVGEAGVEIADRSGYVSWAIHRLLPTVIEASLWAQDYERAERHGARLRRDSERLGHRLGLAWATTCDALVARLRDGDAARAVALMRDAADALDAVPFPFDAARLRRNLAQLLIADGDRDAAMRELRHAHDVFARLGAERELRGARDQRRAIGSRPPSRAVSAAGGSGTLTDREREIAHLVAARKSNKDIGTILGISARTVSTHLSNIFAKLEVESRGELTDLVREGGV